MSANLCLVYKWPILITRTNWLELQYQSIWHANQDPWCLSLILGSSLVIPGVEVLILDALFVKVVVGHLELSLAKKKTWNSGNQHLPTSFCYRFVSTDYDLKWTTTEVRRKWGKGEPLKNFESQNISIKNLWSLIVQIRSSQEILSL